MTFRHLGAALAACVFVLCAGVSSADPSAKDKPSLAGDWTHVPSGGRAANPLRGVPACDTGSSVYLDPDQKKSVCGVYADQGHDVYAYLGIQYAHADRWQDPKIMPLDSRQAVAFGPYCPQLSGNFESRTGLPTKEECLYLNIWRPVPKSSNPTPLPVMVFIHGGAFISGAGSDLAFNGSALARQGVIVVTVNYRLGALGFLVGDLKDAHLTGNYGLKDQQMALQWVHQYIHIFDGAPDQVTLFGESAGAMSTALHLFDIPDSKTPGKNELFRSAILQSDVGGSAFPSLADAAIIGNKFLSILCGKTDRTACLSDDLNKQYDGQRIADLQLLAMLNLNQSTPTALNLVSRGMGMLWVPVVDGGFVQGQPFDGYAAGMEPKPFVLGVNKDEGNAFLAMQANLRAGLWAYKYPSPDHFAQGLTQAFPGMEQDIAQKARYQRPNRGFSWYDNYGAAFANILTDNAFVCGNLMIANKALEQTPDPSIFYYEFDWPAFFNLMRFEAAEWDHPLDNGACDYDSVAQVSCHAAELPYVFNMVNYFANNHVAPKQADLDLASAMNTAWADFAKNPTSPGTAWLAFKPGQKLAKVWGGTGSDRKDIGAAANCSLWGQRKYEYKSPLDD